MNPIHYKCPNNSPEKIKMNYKESPKSSFQRNDLSKSTNDLGSLKVKPYDDRADESESDEFSRLQNVTDLYGDIDDKEEGQGQSVPIPIPKKTEVKTNDTWNIVFFGD